jgi:hypothetical protein
MIDRLNPRIESVKTEEERPNNKLKFDASNVQKLPLATTGQLVYWDTDTTGLSVLRSMATRRSLHSRDCVNSLSRATPATLTLGSVTRCLTEQPSIYAGDAVRAKLARECRFDC